MYIFQGLNSAESQMSHLRLEIRHISWKIRYLKIENVEFCSAMSVLVISHHDSYKYAFKTFPFQHVVAIVVFYRATLCVSAFFAVCRVRPSVTFICIQTAEDIVKLLSRPGSLIILVFDS